MGLYNNPVHIPLALSPLDKKAVGTFLEKIAQEDQKEIGKTMKNFASRELPAWQRYIDGIYSHPKTWWVGIIQMQMVMGIWGSKHRSEAMIRQNLLSQVLSELLADENRERSQKLIMLTVRFNIKYRKANISGRFHGGMFTNYASMGGRFGRGLSRGMKWSGRLTNFTIASFGAAIQAIAKDFKSTDAILNSIITGKPERLPYQYKNLITDKSMSNYEMGLRSIIEGELHGVNTLNQRTPGPVPIREFCSRPENINLRNICK